MVAAEGSVVEATERELQLLRSRLAAAEQRLEAAQVEAALAASHACFQDWRRASFAERGEVLRAVAKRLRDDARAQRAWVLLDQGHGDVRVGRGAVVVGVVV